MDNRNASESLPDFVRRVRNEKGLSTTDVENESGGQISDAYVTRIENGYVKNVSPEKLTALAKGLGISGDEIFAVARGKPLDLSSPNDKSPLDTGYVLMGRELMTIWRISQLPESEQALCHKLIDTLYFDYKQRYDPDYGKRRGSRKEARRLKLTPNVGRKRESGDAKKIAKKR